MDETTATSKIVEDNEENEKLRSQIQSLKERLQSTSLIAEENAAKAKKYKTLADIAATQAQSTSHLNKVKKDAVLELRKQLHLKWTQSEEDVIIGKLQQELFTTKAAYRKFVRKYETVFVNLRKKELEVRRLEEESDQKDQLLLTLESKHAKETATLHSALHKKFGQLYKDDDDVDKGTAPATKRSIAVLMMMMVPMVMMMVMLKIITM